MKILGFYFVKSGRYAGRTGRLTRHELSAFGCELWFGLGNYVGGFESSNLKRATASQIEDFIETFIDD